MDTLNTFFNLSKETVGWVKTVTQTEEFKLAKELISQENPSYELATTFYEKMILRLCDALEIPIGDVLTGGWRKYREILQYRDMTSPAEGFHEVTLAAHTIISEHAPTIQPMINEVPLAKLQFDITVSLNFAGGILFIREGKIMKGNTGTCIGSGKIEYKGHKLIEKETGEYKLPGTHSFNPGIRI